MQWQSQRRQCSARSPSVGRQTVQDSLSLSEQSGQIQLWFAGVGTVCASDGELSGTSLKLDLVHVPFGVEARLSRAVVAATRRLRWIGQTTIPQHQEGKLRHLPSWQNRLRDWHYSTFREAAIRTGMRGDGGVLVPSKTPMDLSVTQSGKCRSGCAADVQERLATWFWTVTATSG